jgi:hypothetical protein
LRDGIGGEQRAAGPGGEGRRHNAAAIEQRIGHVCLQIHLYIHSNDYTRPMTRV